MSDKPQRDRTCDNCDWFRKDDYPPVCVRFPEYVARKPEDWCGEHKRWDDHD